MSALHTSAATDVESRSASPSADASSNAPAGAAALPPSALATAPPSENLARRTFTSASAHPSTNINIDDASGDYDGLLLHEEVENSTIGDTTHSSPLVSVEVAEKINATVWDMLKRVRWGLTTQDSEEGHIGVQVQTIGVLIELPKLNSMPRKSVACVHFFVSRDPTSDALQPEDKKIVALCSYMSVAATNVCEHVKLLPSSSTVQNELKFVLAM